MLRVFEAFAGVGSQRMALRNIGIDFEVVGISDVDRYALLAYDAIHHNGEPVEEIHNMGVCTDICVISNALILRSAFPNIPIYVHANGCAGSSPDAHDAALNVMTHCCIDILI